jgi:hypothetical protein
VILFWSAAISEDRMGRPLEIRTDLASPEALRTLARRERSRRTATRLLAIAHALEGTSRAEAARLVGLERQALRDAVIRYNAEGIAGSAKAGTQAAPVRCRAGVAAGGDPARPR